MILTLRGLVDGCRLPNTIKHAFYTQVLCCASAMSKLQTSGRSENKRHGSGCAACPTYYGLLQHAGASIPRSLPGILWRQNSRTSTRLEGTRQGTVRWLPGIRSQGANRTPSYSASPGVVSRCLDPTRWVKVPGSLHPDGCLSEILAPGEAVQISEL